MMLGNGTSPSSDGSDTSLANKITECGLTQVTALTWRFSGIAQQHGNVTADYEWTSTCNGVKVNTTGLETAETLKYFAGSNFTDATLNNGDKLNITWTIWIS